MRKKADSWLLRMHSHCADVLMEDYGIPPEHRVEICREIDKIYYHISVIHDVIIASIRGWAPIPQTDALKAILEGLKTHEPENHKSRPKPPI